jgi:hypothetical protein
MTKSKEGHRGKDPSRRKYAKDLARGKPYTPFFGAVNYNEYLIY